jgi:uncharacterized protein (UPF0332 family)
LTPEALGHLDKARNSLAKASGMIDIGYCDEAGRCAYLAAFHAALAFIFEQTGKAPKTHAGVRGQFGNLTKNDPRFDVPLKKFLSQAYEMKTVADYDMITDVSVERALEAIKMATRFVDCISAVIV